MKAYYENRTYSLEIPVIAFLKENMNFVAHWHPSIEVVYVCEGSIGIGINSEYKVLEKGEMAVCASNDIHYYHSGEELTSSIMLMVFKPDILSGFEYWPDKRLPASIYIDHNYMLEQKADKQTMEMIRTIFERIIRECSQKNKLYSVFTVIRIVELFMSLFRCFPDYYNRCKKNHASTGSEIGPMQKALKYIEGKYTDNITLEMVSEEAGLSCFYFSRLFKKTTGMNFNLYLTRVRIDKAEALIKSSSKSILEIAYETGFNSIRTFNRSFKALKRCVPCSLRQ